MRNDRLLAYLGAGVFLIVAILAALAILLLGPAEAGVVAGILIALSVVLGTVPPIIRALGGR
jgi:hypothetical protein